MDTKVGAAVTILGWSLHPRRTWQIGIGSAHNWTVRAAELIAIDCAVEAIQEEAMDRTFEDTEQEKTFTIISDSQSAIRAITTATCKSGQSIVLHFLDRVRVHQERQIKVRLYWIPGHSDNVGNDTADWLAKQAIHSEEDNDFRRLVSAFRRATYKKIEDQWHRGWSIAQKGQHLKQIDGVLPAKRSLRVYGSLTRHQAYLMVQLRTGHSWLTSQAKLRGFIDNDRCVCGVVESWYMWWWTAQGSGKQDENYGTR